VNAALVLILVSIFAAAVLAQKVITWMPVPARGAGRLGARVLVVAPSAGPSDAAMRAATLLARPDGGSTDLVMTRTAGEPPPDAARLRSVRKRITRHGFEGELRAEVAELSETVARAEITGEHSLVIVDEPTFDKTAARILLLVIDGGAASPTIDLVAGEGEQTNDIAAEIGRRLRRDAPRARSLRRRRPAGTGSLGHVNIRAATASALTGDHGTTEAGGELRSEP
jgi:hypothetical protein